MRVKRFMLGIVAVLLAIPVLYVLSVGPAIWASHHGLIDFCTLDQGWRPVFGLLRRPVVGPALQWYAELWSEWVVTPLPNLDPSECP